MENTFAIHNLGCKVNYYEAEKMARSLRECGCFETAFTDRADIYIVNTCTVTSIADKKSRQLLHRAKEMNPEALIVAAGCYVETGKEALLSDGCVDLFVGNQDKERIGELVAEALQRRDRLSHRALDTDLKQGRDHADKMPSDTALEQRVDRLSQMSRKMNLIAEEESSEVSIAENNQDKADAKEAGDEIHITRDDPARSPGRDADTGEPPSSLHQRTRAFLKIQDGCDRYCTYCIIPHARGPVVSYPREEILAEAGELIQRGYRELVVTGIHVSSYGRGMTVRPAAGPVAEGEVSAARPAERGTSEKGASIASNPGARAVSYKTDPAPLASLLEALSALPGLKRLRLSSLEPTIITPEFARRISRLPNLCPHFHLSLQSGCDATLRRMNRHYTAAQFREAAALLREAFPHPALTTDVIVGFPGETEEEFEESLAFCREMDFFEMHIFPYSKRKGTVAEKMPGSVRNAVKGERSRRLRELRDECEDRFLRYYIGRTVEVLPEEEKTVSGKQYLTGHTPEYCLAAVDGASAAFAPGEIVSGRVIGVEQQHLLVKVE